MGTRSVSAARYWLSILPTLTECQSVSLPPLGG